MAAPVDRAGQAIGGASASEGRIHRGRLSDHRLGKVASLQKLTDAAIYVQRAFRAYRMQKFSWLLRSCADAECPVRLPTSPDDIDDIPTSSDPSAHDVPPHLAHAVWHTRLSAAASAVKACLAEGSKARCSAQLAYDVEVGKFVAACRAASVLVCHQVMLDPHGTRDWSISRGVDGAMEGFELPTRISRENPMFQQLRPRFDGDRVYVHDGIVILIVGGSISQGVDLETAWRLYKHDVDGYQALADAIANVDIKCRIVLPHIVVVKYCGFKAICRPQCLPEGAGPFDLVLGPLVEAMTAFGSPGDLPDLWRAAVSNKQREVSLVLHEWEQRNPFLREDLQRIAESIGVQGYPVVLDATDLPPEVYTTALLRMPGGEMEFRSPTELLPPEVSTDSRPVEPLKRLRLEALRMLRAGPLPLSHKASGAVGSTSAWIAPSDLQSISFQAGTELPQVLLQRISREGPPLDSRSWTRVFHECGLNMRHLGRVGQLAEYSVRQSLYREALARGAKWLFRKALWQRKPWVMFAHMDPVDVHKKGPEKVALGEVARVFNLVLGGGCEAVKFWEDELVPETTRRFSIPASELDRRKILPAALQIAMEHHLGVRFHSLCAQRKLFDSGVPQPFDEAELAEYAAVGMRRWFPHALSVQTRLSHMRLRHASLDVTEEVVQYASQKFPLIGFHPQSRTICSRGSEWLAVSAAPQYHMRNGRPDKAYEALNLKLSFQRALCDGCAEVGGTLQDIAVSLMNISTPDLSTVDVDGDGHMDSAELVNDMYKKTLRGTGSQQDDKQLIKIVWVADTAIKMMPTALSGWWAHIAALEAEWCLGKFAEAKVRLYRLESVWERFAADQPVLRLRLDTVMTRLATSKKDWALATHHAAKCVEVAQASFGGVHKVTAKMLAKLGDMWACAEKWQNAADAYRRALACCASATTANPLMEGRLHYEIGVVLNEQGDLLASKEHAEISVKALVPHFLKRQSNGMRAGPTGPSGGALALDALMFTGSIYEKIIARSKIYDTSPLPLGAEPELVRRAIRCYEFYLEHYPPDVAERSRRRNGSSSNDDTMVGLVKSVLRLRMQMLGSSEKPILTDALETLMISAGITGDGYPAQIRGVTPLHPRSQTRAVANAALSIDPAAKDLAHKIDELCEDVGLGALRGGLMPSEWFDATLHTMGAGLTEAADSSNPTYKATMDMLDLFRYFSGEVNRAT